MKPALVLAAAAFATLLGTLPAAAIDATLGEWARADATIGRDVTDDDDVLVKPCECEPVADPGFFRLPGDTGRMVRVHYEDVEGQTVTTSDGTVIGVVTSVQNANGTGPILLLVRVEGGVLGEVDRINLRRNAVVWTDDAPVIDTTIDDLRASLQRLGL